MVKLRSLCMLLLFLSFISGCDNTAQYLKTDKDDWLFNKISEVNQTVENEDWEKALQTIDEFEENYEQRKWKMQLLGESDDAEELEVEMRMFKEHVKDEDKVESKKSLQHIHYRLFELYNI
ncbi:DUF4363 family protein [Bacillus shivajii]|uniref:DUF4363 family protein n=1 Tax=Bacillus shivajii TaxID=1983719 RepID=UPI001CFB1A25|nr:DUF4363 family protein [Bacillus shivajii]UCZ52596.1 DUF4363 family protein [Bacillus shivajii]